MFSVLTKFESSLNNPKNLSSPYVKVNLNDGLHLEGWWMGVFEQFKRPPNTYYLSLEFLNVYKLLFQQLFNKE